MKLNHKILGRAKATTVHNMEQLWSVVTAYRSGRQLVAAFLLRNAAARECCDKSQWTNAVRGRKVQTGWNFPRKRIVIPSTRGNSWAAQAALA